MTDFSYLLTPFLAWLFAGILKFLINSIRAHRFAFDLIGYGGMPSNHSAIVASMVALIAFKEGMHTPAFGVAITLAFIVILDATSLRKQVGRHASAINKLVQTIEGNPIGLRERMGHSRLEVLVGVLVGVAIGCLSGYFS